MKKIIMFLSAVGMLSFIFPVTPIASAAYEEDYDYVEEGDIGVPNIPSENDPFWSFVAQLTSPTDPNCGTVALAQLTADGVPNAAAQATSFCAQFSTMRTDMQSGMDMDGESVETSLFNAANWHAIDGLYFQHSTGGVLDGKIQFNQTIDFFTYDFMYFMMTFGDRIDMNEGRIGLEADIVNGLADYGATLTMYNVPAYDNPVILVDGAEDTEGVVSSVVYDAAAGTITFTASHFSTFEAVESGTVLTPRINKVKTRKYTSKTGKEKVKLTVYGNNFKKNAKMRLGGKKASKVKWKSKRKLVAYFSLNELKKMGRSKLKVKVINSGGTEKEYKWRRVNIKKIKPLKK